MIEVIRGSSFSEFNEKAKEATGEYLLFLSPTDKLVENLEEITPPAPWFYGRTQIIDDRGQPLASFLYYPHKHYRLKREHFIPLAGTIISRELFLKVGGFRTDLECLAEYDLYFRLSKVCKPVAISNVISHVCERLLTYHEKLARIDAAHKIRKAHVKGPFDRYFGYRTWRRQLQRVQCAKH